MVVYIYESNSNVKTFKSDMQVFIFVLTSCNLCTSYGWCKHKHTYTEHHNYRTVVYVESCANLEMHGVIHFLEAE